MRILLVNPWIHDFAAFDLWMKPLGLLYIGALLERAGHEVALIDCLDRLHPAVSTHVTTRRFGIGKPYAEEIEKPAVFASVPRRFKRYGIPPSAFEHDLARGPRPDLILVTSIMTYWYRGVEETIATLKRHFPATPVVLGGIYATLCTEHARRRSGADYVIAGNGLTELAGLIEHLSGQAPSAMAPVALDEYPLPAYHLYPQLASVSMLSSLGCPFHCTYCASRILQPQFRERRPADVIREIVSYHERYAIHDIAWYDDALLVNAEQRFMPIAEELATRNLPVRFHTPNGIGIRTITPRIAALFRAAHFTTLRLSFESSIERIQQASSMKTTNDDFTRAVRALATAGYDPRDLEVYVMLGLPGQHPGEVRASLDFVHAHGLIIKLVQYSPIPHTADFAAAATRMPALTDEPLLHNNTTYAFLSDECGAKAFTELKHYVKELNKKIETKS